MKSVENRILIYLNLIHELSEDAKKGILLSLWKSSEEEKTKILMIVYKRYKDFINNTKRLRMSITLASNGVKSLKEQNDADKILEEII